MTQPTDVALTLLQAAGHDIPADEAARIAASYAPFRARVDALYAIGTDAAEPALDFRPR
jgi:hypothetical protein